MFQYILFLTFNLFQVFDGASGSCKLAKDVPECSNYYGAATESTVASRAQATQLQNIEDDIQKQFNDERTRLRQLRVKRWIMEEEVNKPLEYLFTRTNRTYISGVSGVESKYK